MRDQLIAEGVDPDAVLTPAGVLIIDGPTHQYVGCLKVIARTGSDDSPEAASWRGPITFAVPRRVSPISSPTT